MERYKWYRIGLPISHEEFLSLLKNGKAEDHSQGEFKFKCEEDERSHFVFLLKSSISRIVLDLNGNTSTELIPSYSLCEIALFKSKENSWLRIVNAPRSVRELLNRMEALAGFGFSAEPVTFLQKNKLPKLPRGSEYKLISIKALKPIPAENALARIEAASKDGINLKSFSLLSDSPYSLEQLTFEVVYAGIKGQISVTNSGVLKIGGQLAPLLLETIESDITNMTK